MGDSLRWQALVPPSAPQILVAARWLRDRWRREPRDMQWRSCPSGAVKGELELEGMLVAVHHAGGLTSTRCGLHRLTRHTTAAPHTVHTFSNFLNTGETQIPKAWPSGDTLR